ncbi:MAG: CpaF family protein [Candidatus Omnitrophica bacterium]|nr:CpaF family protein [Candidatus Omnitrophota bacterium]
MDGTLKDRIRRILFTQHGYLFEKGAFNKEESQQQIKTIIEGILNRPRRDLGVEEKEAMVMELLDDVVGLGPLEKLLRDPDITEIMINGFQKVFVEKRGKKELLDMSFESNEQLMCIIYRMLEGTRKHVDEANPYTEVALEGGTRVNIIIPPLAADGPAITIRKFLKEFSRVEDFVNVSTMDARMAEFLVGSIKAKVNIIFSGATGSGKTTTVNVLSSYINNRERIVTIEDTAELHLSQDHVVRLEAKGPSIEGKGEISLRQLFINSLRMRPDRIILGEVRGVEAVDMLQAMCSGHRGGLAVIHASSPSDVIHRLETMMLISGLGMSLEAIYRQISSAINLIIQHEQLLDGSRKITHITQTNGIRDGQIVLEDLFVYDIDSVEKESEVRGRWKATGIIPVFAQAFKNRGVSLSADLFRKD